MTISISGFKKLERLRMLHLVCCDSEYAEPEGGGNKAGSLTSGAIDQEIAVLERDLIVGLGFKTSGSPKLFSINGIHFVYRANSPGLKFLFFKSVAPSEIRVDLDVIQSIYDR